MTDYLHHLLLPETLAQIGLLIAGIIGICIAIKTLDAIKKQVDAAVKSERAWVMVDLEKAPGMGGLIVGSSRSGDGPERHSVHFCVRCVCSNQGQTAARIIEKRCAMIVINEDHELPDLPNLNIEIRDPIPHYLKANGDPWHDDWTVGIEGAEFPPEGKLFVIYGVVQYTHLFSDEIAQTTFGYSLGFERKLKRLVGKPKYNEST